MVNLKSFYIRMDNFFFFTDTIQEQERKIFTGHFHEAIWWGCVSFVCSPIYTKSMLFTKQFTCIIWSINYRTARTTCRVTHHHFLPFESGVTSVTLFFFFVPLLVSGIKTKNTCLVLCMLNIAKVLSDSLFLMHCGNYLI